MSLAQSESDDENNVLVCKIPTFIARIENIDVPAADIVEFFKDLTIKKISLHKVKNKVYTYYIEFNTNEDLKQALNLTRRKHLNGRKLQIQEVETVPRSCTTRKVNSIQTSAIARRTPVSTERMQRSKSVENIKYPTELSVVKPKENYKNAEKDKSKSSSASSSLFQPSIKYFNQNLKLKNTLTPLSGRPKLNLLPRTKPLDQDNSVAENIKRSSIFGDAKPVDTLSKELEIEERLNKEKATAWLKRSSISESDTVISESDTVIRESNTSVASSSCTFHIKTQSCNNSAKLIDNAHTNKIENNKHNPNTPQVEEIIQVADTATKIADEDEKKAFMERQLSRHLYCSLMEPTNDMNNFSLLDLHLHHVSTRAVILERYIKQTNNINKDVANKNREALALEINARYEALKKQKSEAQQSKDAHIPPEMLQAIENVRTAYETKMFDKCEKISQISDLEQDHELAFAQALDSFDLLTEFMLGDKQAAYCKILSELKELYESIKVKYKTIQLGNVRQSIEVWFLENLEGTANNVGGWSELKNKALGKFDEYVEGMSDDNVTQQRLRLENLVQKECKNLGHRMALQERSRALQEYRNHMNKYSETSTRVIDLQNNHRSCFETALKNYKHKTFNLPQEIAKFHLPFLRTELNGIFENFKEKKMEKQVLQRHEDQTRELSQATGVAREVYSSEITEHQNLGDLEERHKIALSRALDTFDVITEHLSPDVSKVARNNLLMEFKESYINCRKQLIEKMLNEQSKLAQASFSERMRHAVRDGDSWPRLEAQAKSEALATFDLATKEVESGEVAVYRAKLEESFAFCLELVKTVRDATGDSGICCVCTEQRAAVVFQPCHHLVCCDKCSRQLSMCAMCRAPVLNRLHVYQQ